jgi:hypothetical protein
MDEVPDGLVGDALGMRYLSRFEEEPPELVHRIRVMPFGRPIHTEGMSQEAIHMMEQLLDSHQREYPTPVFDPTDTMEIPQTYRTTPRNRYIFNANE